jgi:hypothetical protein
MESIRYLDSIVVYNLQLQNVQTFVSRQWIHSQIFMLDWMCYQSNLSNKSEMIISSNRMIASGVKDYLSILSPHTISFQLTL